MHMVKPANVALLSVQRPEEDTNLPSKVHGDISEPGTGNACSPEIDLRPALGDGPHRATVRITRAEDILEARQQVRLLAQSMGLSSSRITLLCTAVSELARNIVLYARSGELVISRVQLGAVNGMEIRARDKGPGIESLETVLAGGYSTSGGLGMGLSGLKRAMDEFEINSKPGKGTEVIVRIKAGR
jgi:serine/threonine-protein kinase RsbT